MNESQPPLAEDADRILLVDDDATNLDVLRHTLDGRGYRLFVTRSGESAIEVARRVHPVLVLLDVVMPGIDGYETCRRLKDDPQTREAAVIFLSSLDEAKDKVRGLEVGAVDFVSKPFQKDEVVARVNTHLTLQRLRRHRHRHRVQAVAQVWLGAAGVLATGLREQRGEIWQIEICSVAQKGVIQRRREGDHRADRPQAHERELRQAHGDRSGSCELARD